ncbi:hydroxyacid dehydrogenase [Oleiharenicola lentus]|uniref:hydroxyacid dehydrogenase n=1 Tax=Oleiharenicola lentus TaxID=2508720 RepID=UPI003F67D79F
MNLSRSLSSTGFTQPKAVLLTAQSSLGNAYGEETLRSLRELLDFNPDSQLLSTGTDLSEIEIVLSGWGAPKLDAAFFNQFSRVRIVFHAAGSVRQMMTDEAWERGVRVVTAAKVNATPVAEFTFAQIILSLKNAFSQSGDCRRTRTLVRQIREMPGAHGSTIGLLSLGEIGRQVARRLAQLDVRVIAYDPFIRAERAAELGVTLCSLEEVFARADVVSCHTPLLPATERMVRGRHFSSMKPGATFINTARGGVIAEDEMIAVLKARPDLFALLDVTFPDPPASESPLFDLPNVLLTPHIAGSIDRECLRMGRFIAEEVRRYLRNETLHGEITRAQAVLLA